MQNISSSPVGASIYDNKPLTPDSHIVQFYDGEEMLYDAVAHFLAAGLRADEPAVVIATDEHRSAFCFRLAALGVDVGAALRKGNLKLVDAREALSLFMVDGMP